MSSWLLKKLNESEEDYPNPKYAFSSTVNWVRALSIICEEQINEESVYNFYNKITRINTNKAYVTKAIASTFSSLNYLQTLKSLMVHEDNMRNSINAHIAIVCWYYCIYNSSKAMIAISNNSYQDNHTKTASAFHELAGNRGLIMSPFDFVLSDITKSNRNEQIILYRNGLRKGQSLQSDYYPRTKDNALDCIYSYLNGTADYIEWKEKEKLKKSKTFKERGLNDFKKKEAQQFRDDILENKKINFLTQAFRYRGKANYRDCIYFNENYHDNRINTFISDLEFVAQKFLMMSSFYLSKRIEHNEWESFINSLNLEARSCLLMRD